MQGAWGPNPCAPVNCTSGFSSNATWNQTLGDTFGTYTCLAGYHATNSQVYCTQNGASASWGVNPCTPVYCAPGSSLNATWNQTLADTNGIYTCQPGYHATNSQVYCMQNGASATWGPNPCTPVYCAPGSSLNATWNQTLADTNGTYTCQPGYYATNSKVYCTQQGTSASWGINPCQPSYCLGGSLASATWNQTPTGSSGTYTCLSGYYSSNPQVSCSQNGATASWGPNPCNQVNCTAGFSTNATWPTILAGTSINYTCAPGYYSPNTTVSCLQNGSSASWGNIALPCLAVFCLAGSSVNASWPRVQSAESSNYDCQPNYYSPDTSFDCVLSNSSAEHRDTGEPCQPIYCPSEVLDNADWPETQAADTAIGDCEGSYYGSPSRTCSPAAGVSTSTWESAVLFSCQPCNCNANGSLSTNCSSSGVCSCKSGYSSESQCSTCSPGNFGNFCARETLSFLPLFLFPLFRLTQTD